ncbi:MAG: hypothetical protein WCV91_03475 [Candidatus Margulisiibacteriota bacterium]
MNFRRAVFLLVLFFLLAGVHLLIVAQNINLKYQLTDIKIKLGEITSQNRLIGSSVSREENLAIIESKARSSLGMLFPEKIIYIVDTKEATRKNVIL